VKNIQHSVIVAAAALAVGMVIGAAGTVLADTRDAGKKPSRRRFA
jgi:hypothetical protein